ncbi:MAG: GFA family protein [Alphaproteobacteria bacterium]|nr:GFA family protein [Alphaproteobacteria bacterium]
MSGTPFTWRSGGCHCGAVRFEAALPDVVEAQSCNCSICAKTGFVHVIVPESRFRLLAGADALTEYRFNTGVAKHLFCAECGVKSFYRPRSNPDGWSINSRCLDETEGLEIRIEAFDGRNWEANATSLSHLSKEPA